MRHSPALVWLDPDDPFPDPVHAWSAQTPAPGLLAAGGDLSPQRLLQAYAQGVFPWYSEGEPILWWSTDPRMVLRPSDFLWHHDIRKKARRWRREGRLQIRFDHPLADVMTRCAQAQRPGQAGSWIHADMVTAYARLESLGHAHSVTAWLDDEIMGGLYVLVIGRMVFGESMFTRISGGSKLALAALVAWARAHQLPLIDCQQQTRHLQNLGGQAIDRASFLTQVRSLVRMSPVSWHFDPDFWNYIDPTFV
jgi:leucyl/phenylalanyl-tRNA--protein transferase